MGNVVYCSFCGSALPGMRSHVDEAIRIALEKQRNENKVSVDRVYHEMQMESKDKDIRRDEISAKTERTKYTVIIVYLVAIVLIILLIALIPALVSNTFH